MRLFTGLDANIQILDRFAEFIQINRGLKGVKWVRSESIHITAYFIGETTVFELEEVVRRIKKVCNKTAPFSLTSTKVDFSPGKNPYMIWQYFNQDAFFTNLCTNLSNELGRKTPLRTEIIPHITLGRFKKQQCYYKLSQLEPSNIELEVTKLTLWKSALNSKSNKYQKIHEFDLKG